VTLQSFRWVIL